MAIIIEEEKKGSNVFVFFGWLVVIAIIVVAIYYIFFIEPPSAVILPTGTLQQVGALPVTSVNPQDVINNQEFQSLQPYIAEPSSTGPAALGRMNPFIAP